MEAPSSASTNHFTARHLKSVAIPASVSNPNRCFSAFAQNKKMTCHMKLRHKIFPLATLIFLTNVASSVFAPSRAAQIEWPGGTLASYDFDVSEHDSHVRGSFVVQDYRSYVVSLRFHYAGSDDLRRVYRLVGLGEAPSGAGTPLPIHIRLLNSDGRPIVDRTLVTKSSFVHAYAEADKNQGALGRIVVTEDLQPGHYTVEADTTQDTSQFSGIPCQLSVEAYANLRFIH